MAEAQEIEPQWTDHGIQSDGWRLRSRPLTPEEVEARARAIAARIAKPGDVPGQGSGSPALKQREEKNDRPKNSLSKQAVSSENTDEEMKQEQPDNGPDLDPESNLTDLRAGNGAHTVQRSEPNRESEGNAVQMKDSAQPNCAPVRNSTETAPCAPVRSLIQFPVRTGAQTAKSDSLRTGAHKQKPRKTKDLPELRTGAQTEEEDAVKTILPTPLRGWWWVVDADASGFKIKLRWREGAPPHSVVFPRLGKNEFKTLMGVSSEERRWLVADRIGGDLDVKGRGDIAERLGLESGDNQATLKAG